jgi:hypothetical protein
MHCDCIGEAGDTVPGHQRCQQQRVFCTTRSSVKSDLASRQAKRAESGQRFGRSIKWYVDYISGVPTISPFE